jgi:hypothetical protein
VRSSGASAQPLILWSPAPTETCTATAASLDELRKLAPGFEAHGVAIDRTAPSVLKGPALGRYELLQAIPGPRGVTVPADVLKLLGWTEADAQSPGAYPFKGAAPAPGAKGKVTKR